MKPPALQGTILSFLKAAREPMSSRDLAARFLLIHGADEETCRRLLAPILSGVPGVTHDPASGWRLAPRASGAKPVEPRGDAPPASAPPAAAPPAAASPDAAPAGPDGARVVEAAAWDAEAGPQSLRDFIALAADGAGPGGSGVPRAVTYLPVIDGEELQEEHLPAWGLDSEGTVVGGAEAGDAETLDAEAGDAMAAPDDPDSATPGSARPGAGPGLGAAEIQDLAEAAGDLPVVAHRAAREIEPLRRLAEAAGIPFHPRAFSAARLGHLLLGLKANHAATDLAAALGVEAPGPDDCRGRARLVARAWLRLVPLLEAKGIATVDAALEFQDLPAPPLDLSGYAFTAEDLRVLPATPGVYRFLDREGRVLYVGKAKNLRSRVGSYFIPSARGTAKGRAILDAVHRLEIETVASELEASLLEAALLQQHRPPVNRQFEVHERPAPYGPRRNLVVVLPDAGAPTCVFHMLREGRYLARVTGVVPAGLAPQGDLQRMVHDFYFGAPDGGDESIDIDWHLVSSFLRRHRDAVNVLDVDECATAAEAVERLRVLGDAALGGAGRVVAR